MTDNWEDGILDDEDICPICGFDQCVPAWGSTSSKVLVIGDDPGDDEMEKGRPFIGRTGGVFKQELRQLGVSLNAFRLCNLWIHPKLNKKNKNYHGCFEYGLRKVLAETEGKELILLIGADTVKYFTNGMSVMSVNGLQVKSPYLSAPVIMAMVQPTLVFHSVLGEVRFALKQFAGQVKKLYE